MIFGWFSLQALQEKEIVKFSTPRNCYFLAENSSCILLDRLSNIKHLTEFLNRPYPRFVFFFKTTNYFQRRLASMALCSQLCVCRHIYCLLFILLRVFYYGFYCSFCCFFLLSHRCAPFNRCIGGLPCKMSRCTQAQINIILVKLNWSTPFFHSIGLILD